MQINCISCGHRFDLGRAYDDYDGPVRCSTCRTLLHVRTEDGGVRGVRFGELPVAPAAPAQAAPAAPEPLPAPTLAGVERQAA